MTTLSQGRQHPINVELISTPRERCLSARLGVVDAAVLEEAEQQRYDQLTVLNEADELVGVVARTRIRALREQGEPLRPDEPELVLSEVQPGIELISLLDQLSRHRAVVYRHPERDRDWFGLITISDLNRQHVRAVIYPILAHLEEQLADYIRREVPDHWDWLRHLSEDVQARLIGRWEIDKRNSVDTDVMTGCTLTELMTLTRKSKGLWSSLGFESQSAFKDAVGSVPDVRNAVMHPVRPLVRDEETVMTLRQTLEAVLHLTARVESAMVGQHSTA